MSNFEVVWSGALERAGQAPGLSRSTGDSSLALGETFAVSKTDVDADIYSKKFWSCKRGPGLLSYANARKRRGQR